MTKPLLTPMVAGFVLLTACGPIRAPGADTESEAVQATLTEQAEPTTPDPVNRPSVELKRASIDWDSARRDFASRPLSPDDETFTTAAASTTPVPILLPSTPIMTASSDGSSPLSFRPLDDGYYAVYKGDAYDMIINGTDRLVAAPGRGLTPTDTELRFEETMTGAQVAFSRYGASYSVEFACKTNAAVTGDGCVTEAEALAAVHDLLIAGTQ